MDDFREWLDTACNIGSTLIALAALVISIRNAKPQPKHSSKKRKRKR